MQAELARARPGGVEGPRAIVLGSRGLGRCRYEIERFEKRPGLIGCDALEVSLWRRS